MNQSQPSPEFSWDASLRQALSALRDCLEEALQNNEPLDPLDRDVLLEDLRACYRLISSWPSSLPSATLPTATLPSASLPEAHGGDLGVQTERADSHSAFGSDDDSDSSGDDSLSTVESKDGDSDSSGDDSLSTGECNEDDLDSYGDDSLSTAECNEDDLDSYGDDSLSAGESKEGDSDSSGDDSLLTGECKEDDSDSSGADSLSTGECNEDDSDSSGDDEYTADQDEERTFVTSAQSNSNEQGNEPAPSQFEWVVGDPPREEEESDDDSNQPQPESDSEHHAGVASGDRQLGQPLEEASADLYEEELPAYVNSARAVSEEEPRIELSNEAGSDEASGEEIRQADIASVERTSRGEWYTPSLFEHSPDSQTDAPQVRAGQEGQSAAQALGLQDETFLSEPETESSADSTGIISDEIKSQEPGEVDSMTSEPSGILDSAGANPGSGSRIEQLIQSGKGGAARLADARLRPITDIKKGLGLNEKFLLMRSFFNNDAMRFTADLDRLNRLGSLAEAEDLLFEALLPNRNWDAQSEADITLLLVVYRRFYS